MPRERYSSALKEVLREIDETQGPAIDAAASLIVESVVNGGTWDLYDTGHMLMREAVGRAGGLTMVTPIRVEVRVEHESRPRAIPPNPKRLFLDQIRDLPEYILARAQLDAGHVLMIGSVSGVNLLPVELAVRARLMGVKTIGLTSVSAFARMTPQHEGGRPAMACERALLVDLGDDGTFMWRLALKNGADAPVREILYPRLGPIRSPGTPDLLYPHHAGEKIHDVPASLSSERYLGFGRAQSVPIS